MGPRILALNSGLILLIVFLAAAFIALVAWLLYRFLHLKAKDDGKPTEDQVLHEEMDRVLKPIDDEEIAKKVSEYKDKEDEK